MTKIQKQMVALEYFLPHHVREEAERLLFAFSIFFLSFSVLLGLSPASRFAPLWPVAQGLFMISFSVLLCVILLETYFQYLYKRLADEGLYTFPVLVIVALPSKKKDVVARIFHSHWGKEIAKRLGLSVESVLHFLKDKEERLIEKELKGALHDIASIIHQEDEHLRGFLDNSHILKDHFVSALAAIEDSHRRKMEERSFLWPIFSKSKKEKTEMSLEESVRREIEDMEAVYQVVFTEQAIMKVVEYFRSDLIEYSSRDARIDFLSELIGQSLLSHSERIHASKFILPSDVRSFIINNES